MPRAGRWACAQATPGRRTHDGRADASAEAWVVARSGVDLQPELIGDLALRDVERYGARDAVARVRLGEVSGRSVRRRRRAAPGCRSTVRRADDGVGARAGRRGAPCAATRRSGR